MCELNIGFIARRGNFNVLRSQIGRGGYSVQRLTSSLYIHLLENLKSTKYDISVDKIALGFGKSNNMQRISMIGNLLFLDLNKYDIIHANAPLPVRPVRMKTGAKLIQTCHGIHSVDKGGSCYYVEPRSRSIFEAAMSTIVDKNLLHSDFIIAVSSLTKRRLTDLGFEGKKIFVVNNGLDERFLKDLPPKHNKKQFVLGYLGPFYLSKNVIFAINAFKKIKDENMRFEIWGRKAYEYPRLLEAARTDRRIKFMGMAPESRLVEVYDNFDAFVYPTLCDQFPGSLIEAQSRGLPVVVFKNGEISEEARRYCLEAEDEEHMANLLNALKENGYSEKKRNISASHARSFTADRQAIETLTVYKKIYGK